MLTKNLNQKTNRRPLSQELTPDAQSTSTSVDSNDTLLQENGHKNFLSKLRCPRGMWPFVLLYLSLLGWTCSVYVASVLYPLYHLGDYIECALLSFMFALFGILCQISYYRCVVTHPGEISEEWKVRPGKSKADLVGFAENNTLERKKQGQLRYCNICNIFKPDRAHHCPYCNECILKLDHHCPWLNRCVGHRNHKFFMLYLFYLLLMTLLITVSMQSTSVKIHPQRDTAPLPHHAKGVFVEIEQEGKTYILSRSLSKQQEMVFFECMAVLVFMVLFLTLHVNLVFSARTMMERFGKTRLNREVWATEIHRV